LYGIQTEGSNPVLTYFHKSSNSLISHPNITCPDAEDTHHILVAHLRGSGWDGSLPAF